MADQFHFFYNKDFDEDSNKKINMEIMKYAGLYILKKMSLTPDEGGYIFEVPLMGLDEHLEPIMDDLLFHDLIEIDVPNARYKLMQNGDEYIQKVISEIEQYLEKYQDFEPLTRVNLMRRDKVNPLRARFLWGLYDGEFDDFSQWQENWGITADQQTENWREIITKKEFYDMLFEDINHMGALDDSALDQVLKEAEEDRKKDLPQIQITKTEGSESPRDSQRQYDAIDEEVIVERDYYYQDPYYFSPVYDPFFWYVVF